jgi:hypothetical protein
MDKTVTPGELKMRFVFTALLLAAASLCLGGCAKYWYQEGRTFDQCRKDLAASQAEAVRYSDVARTDGIGRYESKFIHESMENKGYHLVGESKLPVRVRRESSPVFGVPGVAGSID